MRRIGLEVQGMSCGHCVTAVRRVLEGWDGVEVEEVGIGSARVAYDPARVAPERLAAAITDEGYATRIAEADG